MNKAGERVGSPVFSQYKSHLSVNKLLLVALVGYKCNAKNLRVFVGVEIPPFADIAQLVERYLAKV